MLDRTCSTVQYVILFLLIVVEANDAVARTSISPEFLGRAFIETRQCDGGLQWDSLTSVAVRIIDISELGCRGKFIREPFRETQPSLTLGMHLCGTLQTPQPYATGIGPALAQDYDLTRMKSCIGASRKRTFLKSSE
jgi:hypothetical protein